MTDNQQKELDENYKNYLDTYWALLRIRTLSEAFRDWFCFLVSLAGLFIANPCLVSFRLFIVILVLIIGSYLLSIRHLEKSINRLDENWKIYREKFESDPEAEFTYTSSPKLLLGFINRLIFGGTIISLICLLVESSYFTAL